MEAFDLIEKEAGNASLSEKSLKRIKKARKQTNSMVSTLTFFWLTVTTFLTNLKLSKEVDDIFHEYLIPIQYLEIAAKKLKIAESREAILDVRSE